MSQVGRYRKPKSIEIESYESFGSNERSARPINRLARSMFDITKNATDVYEIAAHLEAIGYNSYRVKKEFGIDNPFKLAKEIQDITPDQITEDYFWQKTFNTMWLKQLTILLAIFATIIIQVNTVPQNWLTIVWLIIWSVIGSKLVNKMHAELSLENSGRILTILAFWGFVGLATVWTLRFPTMPEATVNLLWWILTSVLWAESLLQETSYKGLILVTIATLAVLPIPLLAVMILLVSIGIFFIRSKLKFPSLESWKWLGKSIQSVSLLIPYGFGIGLLLVELFQLHTENILIAGGILIVMSFASEWLVIWLRDKLADSLWVSKSNDEYISRTKVVAIAIGLLLSVAALVILVFSIFSNDPSLTTTVAHFILYGLSLSFALILLSLDNVLFLSAGFSIAIILMFMGIPLSIVLVLLPVMLALAIFLALQKLEEYGIHVI